MFRDYEVRFKRDGKLVGVFRDFNEAGAITQAWKCAGGASRYSGATISDFVAIKLGLL